MRAVVIGGGYVGRATAWALRRGGYTVTEVDDRRPSGSRASLGLWRESWWESEHFAAILPDWFGDRHREAAEEYLDHLQGVRLPVFDDSLGDWAGEGVYRYTLGEDPGIAGDVERIIPTGFGAAVVYDGGKRLEAEIVVVCAGTRNIALLEASPGIASTILRPRSVAGRVLLFDNSEPFDVRSKVTGAGRLFAVREDPITVAVGSSYQDDKDPAGVSFEREAVAWAAEMGSGSPVGRREGLRDVGGDGKLYVWTEEPGRSIFFLGGTDRFGLGVAGGLAERVIEVLGG